MLKTRFSVQEMIGTKQVWAIRMTDKHVFRTKVGVPRWLPNPVRVPLVAHPLLPDSTCVHTCTHTPHTHLVLCIFSFSRLSCSYITGIAIAARSCRRLKRQGWLSLACPLPFLKFLIIICFISCVLEGNGNSVWRQVNILSQAASIPSSCFPINTCPVLQSSELASIWPLSPHTLRLEGKRLKITSHVALSILRHERQTRVRRKEIIPLFFSWPSRSLMESWALRNLNGNCRLWITDFWKARERSWACGASGASAIRNMR